jgi:hypothetical protein
MRLEKNLNRFRMTTMPEISKFSQENSQAGVINELKWDLNRMRMALKWEVHTDREWFSMTLNRT